MLKLSCAITGDDYQMVYKDTPTSKKKICLMAMCLFVPVMLWFINGYLLVTKVLDGSLWIGLLTGSITALLIFIIERSVIMSQGGFLIATFRLLLGALIAILGSITLDEVIFKSDIDYQVSENREALVQKKEKDLEAGAQPEIDALRSDMDGKYTVWQQTLLAVQKEADGSGGSGKRGVDDITRIKQQVAAQQQIDYEQAKQLWQSKKDTLKEEIITQASIIYASHRDDSLLIRIKAMFDLIKKDGWMMSIYILFTAFLFFLEFLVVIIKMCYPESNYECKLKMIEQIGKERISRIAEKDSLHFDGGQVQPEIGRGKEILNRTNPAIFALRTSHVY